MSLSDDIKLISHFENGVSQGLAEEFIVHSGVNIPGIGKRTRAANQDDGFDIYIASPFRAAVVIKHVGRSKSVEMGRFWQYLDNLRGFEEPIHLIMVVIYEQVVPKLTKAQRERFDEWATFVYVDKEDLLDDPRQAGRRCAQEIRNRWAHGHFRATGVRSFNEGLAKLKEFVGKQGNAQVPKNHRDGDFRLGEWVQNQRRNYTRGSLSVEHLRQLKEIPGWTRDLPAEEFSIAGKESPGFNEGLAKLKEFVGQQGNAQVPINHKEGDFSLGLWAHNQRAKYTRGSLSVERLRQLEDLGFLWDFRDEPFEMGLTALKRFVDRQGHSNVPRNHTDADGFRLGRWLVQYRNRAVYGHLPEAQTEQLFSILRVDNNDRLAILKRDEKKCQLCGKLLSNKTALVRHIVPPSNGGTDDENNLRTICSDCENSKEDIAKQDPAGIFAVLDSFSHLIAPEYYEAVQGEASELTKEYINKHYTACAVRIGRTLEWFIFNLAQAWEVNVDKQTLRLIEVAQASMNELQTAVIEYTTTEDDERRESLDDDIDRHVKTITAKMDDLQALLRRFSSGSPKSKDALSPQEPELTEAPKPEAVLRNIKKKYSKHELVRTEIDSMLKNSPDKPGLMRSILKLRNDGAHANWEGQSREVDKGQIDEMMFSLTAVINKLVNVGEVIVDEDAYTASESDSE